MFLVYKLGINHLLHETDVFSQSSDRLIWNSYANSEGLGRPLCRAAWDMAEMTTQFRSKGGGVAYVGMRQSLSLKSPSRRMKTFHS